MKVTNIRQRAVENLGKAFLLQMTSSGWWRFFFIIKSRVCVLLITLFSVFIYFRLLGRVRVLYCPLVSICQGLFPVDEKWTPCTVNWVWYRGEYGGRWRREGRVCMNEALVGVAWRGVLTCWMSWPLCTWRRWLRGRGWIRLVPCAMLAFAVRDHLPAYM